MIKNKAKQKLAVFVLMTVLLVGMSRGMIHAVTTSDYKERCEFISSNTAKISFTSYCHSTYVYVHYEVNGGQDMNYLMNNNGDTWTWSIDGLNKGDVIAYWFTYQKGTTQYDTEWYHYMHDGSDPTPDPNPNPNPDPNLISGKGCPKDGSTLLILGQDLQSVYNYVISGYFPTPGGVTSYVNLYGLRDQNLGYGGLGEDPSGGVVSDVDWGAGPIHTHNAAFGYPDSALSIGIYMTEEYNPGGLTNIANGVYDAEIDRLGTFINSVQGPVFVRIGYEFDGTWNMGYNNTTSYKNAYKRVINRLRAKADNVISVWQACTSPVDDIVEGYHENIENWYPGDSYVDWVGYSWFLSHHDLQYSLTDEVIAFAKNHNKPVLLSESAPQGYDLSDLTKKAINTGGFYTSDPFYGIPGSNTSSYSANRIWNDWFVPFFDYIHSHSDVIRGVSYINANWDSQPKWAPPYNEGYWGDSRVESQSSIRQKWLDEINSSFWKHGSSNLFNELQP